MRGTRVLHDLVLQVRDWKLGEVKTLDQGHLTEAVVVRVWSWDVNTKWKLVGNVDFQAHLRPRESNP